MPNPTTTQCFLGDSGAVLVEGMVVVELGLGSVAIGAIVRGSVTKQ